MKRIFLLFVVVFCAVCHLLASQPPSRSHLLPEDRYFTSLDALFDRSDSVIFAGAKIYSTYRSWSFEFDSKDRVLRRTLKKKAKVVCYDETLFVNVKGMRSRGHIIGDSYVEAWMLCDSILVYNGPDYSQKKILRKLWVAALISPFTLGLSFVTALQSDDERIPYIHRRGRKNPEMLTREVLLELLLEINPLMYFDFKTLPRDDQDHKQVLVDYLNKLADFQSKVDY